eukprot:133200_1
MTHCFCLSQLRNLIRGPFFVIIPAKSESLVTNCKIDTLRESHDKDRHQYPYNDPYHYDSIYSMKYPMMYLEELHRQSKAKYNKKKNHNKEDTQQDETLLYDERQEYLDAVEEYDVSQSARVIYPMQDSKRIYIAI